jgi:hypothetical protein
VVRVVARTARAGGDDHCLCAFRTGLCVCYGAVVLWCCGAVVLWCCGAVVLWCCGAVVLWCCPHLPSLQESVRLIALFQECPGLTAPKVMVALALLACLRGELEVFFLHHKRPPRKVREPRDRSPRAWACVGHVH